MKNEARKTRIDKQAASMKIREKEVWQDVKKYYKDIANYHKSKEQKQNEIMEKLANYYNASSGVLV